MARVPDEYSGISAKIITYSWEPMGVGMREGIIT
jgi:hypothetical protein